ncbi:MAG: ANTAR domain-containing protein [Betaproteobacteria bacterium]|nr:MAG: ANTAR domain-containing protein [Betaproteobacteria bacterium]
MRRLSHPRTRYLKVLLLHNTSHDVAALEAALSRMGDEVRSISANAITMLREIEAWPPDLILIAADDPTRDMIEQICVASAGRERPIVMFTEADDAQAMRSLVKAGVSAYVVAGCAPNRLRPVIDVALERFAHEQAQHLQIRAAEKKAHDEKLIARAKAQLARHGLDEAAAYAQLRRSAMQRRCTIAEVAADLLGA